MGAVSDKVPAVQGRRSGYFSPARHDLQHQARGQHADGILPVKELPTTVSKGRPSGGDLEMIPEAQRWPSMRLGPRQFGPLRPGAGSGRTPSANKDAVSGSI